MSRDALRFPQPFSELRSRPHRVPRRSWPITASTPDDSQRLHQVFDLLAEDSRPNVYAGKLEVPSSRLRIMGLVHPFLGRSAVSNDLQLDDQVRVCFVTGPNMAGKSTFLKATAVAVLLAHTGSGVPATSMEFAPIGTVFSSVEIVDSLSAGESFYLAEVRRIGALAVALAEHGSAVAVIDEPFRGTNVHDAAEATLAVITRLAAHPAALVLVASHVGEVVPAILADPRIALFHFAADVTGDRPCFDYRLREGASEQRLGMTLLRQEGVLDRLERSAESATAQRAAPAMRS